MTVPLRFRLPLLLLTLPGIALAAPNPANWSAVGREARGQTVNFYLWGGSDNINRYVDTVVAPAVRPAVTAASILVFAFAFSVYEVPLLLGPTAPAPLSVTAYRLYTDPDLAMRPLGLAASLLLALVSSGLLLAYPSHLVTRAP